MKEYDFFIADVQFKVDSKLIKFQVVHNLDESKGLSFNKALENWAYRTDKYTAKSLCNYIMSKSQNTICMTMSKWNKLNKA